MQTEMSIEIDRPIEEVFDYTTNNVTEWSLVVVEEEIIDEKPEGKGTTLRVITEERGRRLEFDGVVTRHEPPTAHSVFMKTRQFYIEAEYLFEDLDGRTRVTQRTTVNATGFARAVFFMVSLFMKKASCNAATRELSNLKRLIETKNRKAPM